MDRSKRKIEHIKHALSLEQAKEHYFDDISFVHQSISNQSTKDVSLETSLGNLLLRSPILINAMTGGGGEGTTKINRQLAMAAKECKIPIAVGSQMASIKDPGERESFEVVRKVNPNGLIFANIGSEATVDQAKMAVDMLEANALQVHLNVIQELVMPEGDRDFSDTLTRIESIAKSLPVPVIVKEVGFGMSRETASQLLNIGVQIVDIGGYGGTNFSKIENARRENSISCFHDWGIPTPISIAEVTHFHPFMSVIAAGGLKTSMDVAKSLALGASACAFAGHLLRILMEEGIETLILTIRQIEKELSLIMCALDIQAIKQFQTKPLIIEGKTYHWLSLRGIDPRKFSLRGIER